MRLWPFGGQTFLDADDEAWVVETWGWFLSRLGGIEVLRKAPLVTPTRAFFPATEHSGHERAEHVFDAVKRYAGMADWPCQLIAQPQRAELRVGEVTALTPITEPPGGT